jgi:hypothetical protein
MFATLLYIELDANSGRLLERRAPAPLVRHADGTVRKLATAEGRRSAFWRA